MENLDNLRIDFNLNGSIFRGIVANIASYGEQLWEIRGFQFLFPATAETSGESVKALVVGTFARQWNERKDSCADSGILLS